MLTINANIDLHFEDLNKAVKSSDDTQILIDGCIGHRYIGAGMSEKQITINGIPGNALGAYLNGSKITVNGNAQDATGDTMNDGQIIIHGSSGDATGYAMRGGQIYVKENAGYRAGIHMKSYKEKFPVLVIGGCAGSFLGEYQAGGVIIVLGIGADGKPPIGNFCGTGMHGGKIFMRCDEMPQNLPSQVMAEEATTEDMASIDQYINEYCANFGCSKEDIVSQKFYVLSPNAKNPYKQLYTSN